MGDKHGGDVGVAEGGGVVVSHTANVLSNEVVLVDIL